MVNWRSLAFLAFVLQTVQSINVDEPQQEAIRVLSNHKVVYSSPDLNQDYISSSQFNARGMNQVYAISQLFLNLILRDEVFPPGFNASDLLDSSPQMENIGAYFKSHWEIWLLQYIGVVTVAVCGVLLALAMPVACFCVCCCRCAGKCGAYPDHYDKKNDNCKRFCTGIVLAAIVIIAMFGVVCTFVTNFYCSQGLRKLPQRLDDSTKDTSLYFDNTGKELHSLLVTNFDELESVLGKILDESGPILKKSLAEITQAVAIDDLTDIVSNLGNVKRYLKDIQNKTLLLQDKAGQLRLGLNGTSVRLMSALNKCSSSRVCKQFLNEYNVSRDLAIAATFGDLPTRLPDLSALMKDISDLMDNDIERKVRGGQKQLDKVKNDIERSIGDTIPKIKNEIHRMGEQLADQANYFQSFLNDIDEHIATVRKDIPIIKPYVERYGNYFFYVGLVMAFMVFIILFCYIFGLFYGFCGKRPGNMYGDDCCNTGTGANWLLAAVYLTFLFSFFLLLVTTAQFLSGSVTNKVACEAMSNTNGSEVFQLVDQRILRPILEERKPNENWSMSFSEIIINCHKNQTIYDVIQVREIYDVNELRNWRQQYGIGGFIEDLKRKIKLDDLQRIQILSPEAEQELKELAESQISDLNFSQYTELLEKKILAIDLITFINRLRSVKSGLNRSHGRLIGPAIDNEILFLEQMQRVVMDMKLAIKNLHNSVQALEEEAKHAKPNFREALTDLMKKATKATGFLRQKGPQFVDELTDQYVNETLGLIDNYVERVINHTLVTVGRCEPLSNSYNATVIAVCNEIIDPFNGLWTSIGWCLMFFLPSMAMALSLVSLYRKSEPYPGPLVEPVVTSHAGEESQHAKKKRRGHRRNASEYLPDSAHYRAGYSYQDRENRFQDVAPRNFGASEAAGANAVQPSTSSSGAQPIPPRYSSNPALEAPPTEYERPPPYYYPGSTPAAGDVPPPLPAPNRT